MTIHAEYPAPSKLPAKLVKELSKSDGRGCTCYAWWSGECGCDADWRSKDEILVDWIWRHPGCDVAELMDAYLTEYKEAL